MKLWHLHAHEEKLAKFAKQCSHCGKQYVNAVALWVHENQKCPKRPQDIDWSLRYGSEEQPEVAKYLGHKK